MSVHKAGCFADRLCVFCFLYVRIFWRSIIRRKEREIVSTEEKINIIKKCKVCRIGLSDNDKPYVIPLNYGYDYLNNVLSFYFHGAAEGKKMDIIKKNNYACFEIDCDTKLIEGETACKFGYSFKSVIGFGRISILENENEKCYGLNMIMRHQTEKEMVYNFTKEQLETVCVYKMITEELTGKQKEFPQK